MQRELFAIEEWIYRASRRSCNPLPINFGIAVECKNTISEDTLQQALKNICSYHPLSCARVILQTPNRGMITTENSQSIPLTLQKVSNVWKTISEQLSIPFHDPMLPLVRVFFYDSPQGHFLYIHFDHALADGISALSWIRTLFALMFNEQPSHSPCINWEDFVQKNQKPEWEHHYRSSGPNFLESIQQWYKSFYKPLWPKHLTYTIFTDTFSSEQTIRLKKTAKKHNSSVHAALAVSFLTAFHENHIFHAKPQRTVLSPVNLRKKYHLPEETYGLFNGTIQTTIDFSKPFAFWKQCELFKKKLDIQLHETDFLYHHYCLKKNLTKSLHHGFAKPRYFDTRQEYDLSITNIGVVSSIHLKEKVKHIYGPIAQGLPTETVLGVVTYEDTLTLSWVSKPFFLSDELSWLLFSRGKEILLSHLE